ncbi:hypothetical protein EIN_337640 [Entamoeba invadens IP1]|uniref:DOCKER domain-containing protein n=1 Tax=Entamoeba invadens IP1 TaxID=370355 RepID=A0A0A1TXD5_ENTIV|nr:hypothetical protein EIN_337640 [Entamoeba invadens IP1]ELP84165.1 hypothetical protein EIN_337640 [Entamoeba invadens IP1]|eukprot:XP_004183511.1 hypothetical protein EIN_337640 [Entamoeba invadens IP1]
MTKRRVLSFLQSLWAKDSEQKVNEMIDKNLKVLDEQVKAEKHSKELRTNTIHFLSEVFEKIRMCVKFSSEFSVSDVEYKKMCDEKSKELTEKADEYKEIVKELNKYNIFPIVQIDKVEDIVNATRELLRLRASLENSEKNEKIKIENQKSEFEKDLQNSRKSLFANFNKICASLKLGDNADLNTLISEEAKSATGKLETLKESAKKNHDLFSKKSAQIYSLSPYTFVFKNWSTVLPIAVKILEALSSAQKTIKDYELKMENDSKQMDIELSLSEDLVKCAAWEEGIHDVVDFGKVFLDAINSNKSTSRYTLIIEMAESLIQQFNSIKASYEGVKRLYGSSQKSPESSPDTSKKSFKMFEKLFDDLAAPNMIKSELESHFRSLRVDERREKYNEDTRKKYATYFTLAVQLLEFQTDEPGSQILEIAKEIRKLENTKILFLEKYVKKDDIEKIKAYAAKNEKFKILVQSENALEKRKRSIGESSEDFGAKMEMFVRSVNDLKNRCEEFLGDVVLLQKMRETKCVVENIYEKEFDMAKKYKECPEIFISCLQSIAFRHFQLEEYTPAAVAIVYIIHYIYGVVEGPECMLKLEELTKVSEDIISCGKAEFVASGDEQMTTQFLVENAKIAALLFEQGKMRHDAVCVLNFVIPLFIQNRNYAELSEAHETVDKLYSQIGDYPVIMFYQVQFFGKEFFGDEHKKMYIYTSKERNNDFNTLITKKYTKVIDGVEMKPLAKTVAQAKDLIAKLQKLENETKEEKEEGGDDEKVPPFIVVGTLTIHNDFEEVSRLGVKFLSSPIFKNEVPYQDPNIPGKDGMCKMTTFFKTNRKLPSMLVREEVVSTNQIIKTPIESSVDDYVKRLETMKKAVQSCQKSMSADNVRNLESAVQGSIGANVNGGFKTVCDRFLKAPDIEKYNAQHVFELFEINCKMLAVSKLDIEIHKNNLKTTEQIQMQAVLDSGFLASSKAIRDVKEDVVNYIKKCGKEELVEKINTLINTF